MPESDASNTACPCPLCGRAPGRDLAEGFRSCARCDVAVRAEKDMPDQEPFEYDGRWARDLDRSMEPHRRAERARRMIAGLCDVRTVLDVGCGAGILVDALREAGYQADGADSAPAAIEYARRHKRGRFFQADGRRLAFRADVSYDLIAAAHVLEHIRDPLEFLDSLREYLRPGGYLYIETPNLDSHAPAGWRRLVGGVLHSPDHRVVYGPDGLRRLLDRAGFEALRSTTWSGSPRLALCWLHAACERMQNGKAGQGEAGKPAGRLRGAIHRVLDSRATDALLYLPNRLSERKGRGVHLMALARDARSRPDPTLQQNAR